MKKFLIFFFLLYSLGFSNAQNPNWIVYSTYNSAILDDYIVALAIDSSQNIWIGTIFGQGLIKFDGTTWTIYNTANSGLPEDNISALAVDVNQNKWIGTSGGLAKFDSTHWTVYDTLNSGLPGDYIISMAIDVNQNKWIGTGYDGFAKFDGINWKVYNDSNSGLPCNETVAIAVDSSGIKWVGTIISNIGCGLAKFDGINWTIYDTSNSVLPHNYAASIAIDGNNNKWIGTGNGLAKFDGTNWSIYNTTNSGIPVNVIRSKVIEINGTYWIGTWGGGLAKFDGVNWTVYNSSNSGLPSDFIYVMEKDGYGNLWIGTYGNGLAVFNEHGVQYNISLISYPSNFNLCVISNASFSLTANGTNLIYQWQESINSGSTWNNISNGGIYSGADSTTLILSNVPGSYNGYQYHCIVSDTLGDTLISNNAILSINPVATAPVISMVGSNLVSSLASTYQWYFNGGIITGATSQTYTPLQNGIYTVVITDSAGCSATSVAYNLLNVGVVEIENERDFTILPNPASEILSIKYKVKSKKAEGSYMVYDIMGQMLLNGSFAKQEFQINISSLAKGVYLLKIEDEEGVAVKRFVKE